MTTESEYLYDATELGYHYIRLGCSNVNEWRKEMLDYFGEEIEPHLAPIWKSLNQGGDVEANWANIKVEHSMLTGPAPQPLNTRAETRGVTGMTRVLAFLLDRRRVARTAWTITAVLLVGWHLHRVSVLERRIDSLEEEVGSQSTFSSDFPSSFGENSIHYRIDDISARLSTVESDLADVQSEVESIKATSR